LNHSFLAGLPTQVSLDGTFLVTTAPAPMRAFNPIVIPGKIVAFAPILAPSLTRVVFKSLEGGFLSLVKHT
jgi:hypothetical protein